MTDEKIKLGEKAREEVKCSNCSKSLLSSEAFRFKSGKTEVYICTNCRDTLNREYEAEVVSPNLVGGLIGGVIAGTIGGLAWYLFVVITKYEIGYLAIGLGYMSAIGVYRGSGKKRGVSLQFMAVAITLLSLLVSNYLVFSQLTLQEAAKAAGGETRAIIGENLVEAAVLLLDRLDLFYSYLLSPISLLIWAIASYVSFSYLAQKKI